MVKFCATLDDGDELCARAVLVATGVQYRRLPLDRLEALEGAGIFYSATEMEARFCSKTEAVVIGGGNSAGQAAMFLSRAASHVHLVVRSGSLAASMSSYLSQRLEADPRVEFVTYAGLKTSPWHDRVAKVCPKGAGALFTVGVKGGYDSCVKLVNNLNLFSHVANLGDARSLIIHSASTTHRQLSEEQQVAAGAAPNVVRLSIGTENPADLIADLDQALALATA